MRAISTWRATVLAAALALGASVGAQAKDSAATTQFIDLGAKSSAITAQTTQSYELNLNDVASRGSLGAPGNSVLELQVGANATITSLQWDLSLTAFDPSWLSELRVTFSDKDGLDGLTFTPGVGEQRSGTQTFSGNADIAAAGLSFQVGSDGVLRLEFHEGFVDGGNPDGLWNGKLTFGVSPVPEPSTYALMALGLLAVGAASRRRAS
ncbi:PEP-CTERM sorting domain-containing protein [Roseateles sp. BYS180W]|uniref:PEP-CTERM sorting domain-containing protein n=1 Tax=Roseateles rivi TaxID=3299028 RepID=A0ABW7FXN0_9BURK